MGSMVPSECRIVWLPSGWVMTSGWGVPYGCSVCWAGVFPVWTAWVGISHCETPVDSCT